MVFIKGILKYMGMPLYTLLFLTNKKSKRYMPLEGRKIPSGGFFSFIKTDIVEDKYFEKRVDS